MKSESAGDGSKHLLVRQYVEQRIQSGELKPGDRLPTENDLMRELSVSRTPVRQALSDLAQDGWIYRIRGSGSYVKRVDRRTSIDIYAMLYSDHRGIEKDMIHGMRRAVAQHPSRNIHLILKHPGNDTSAMIDAISELSPPATGGLVVIPVVSNSRSLNRLLGATVRKVNSSKFVVVQLDRCIPEYGGSYVTSNHQLAGRTITDYLLSMGHKTIGCVYEHPYNTSIRDRLSGVRMALLEAGLGAERAVQLEVPVDHVAHRADEILRWIRESSVTALLCFESELAREMYSVVDRAGLSIPADISLASFDDHAFTEVRDGFLTAVIQRLEDLGHYAVEIILNGLQNPRATPTRMTLESELVVRSSVGPAGQK
jgi:GntR family transcriptional regulator of arabinose operon